MIVGQYIFIKNKFICSLKSAYLQKILQLDSRLFADGLSFRFLKHDGAYIISFDQELLLFVILGRL